MLIAASCGLLFFLVPFFVPKAEKEYGAILAGAGTSILHLTWLGAYSFHHIIDAKVALICATLVGVFSVLAKFEKGNRIYILVAMVGTYLSAPLVGMNMNDLEILAVFLIIWNVSFTVTAFVNNRRDVLFFASYCAVLAVLILTMRAQNDQQKFDLLILQILQFFIFEGGLLYYSVYNNRAMNKEESNGILPLLVLYYFSSDHLITNLYPVYAPWFGIVISVLILTIHLFAKSRFAELKTSGALTLFAAVAFLHSSYFRLVDESLQPLASLALGIIAMLLWKNSEIKKNYFWPLAIFIGIFFYGAILTVISDRFHGDSHFYNWAYGAIVLTAAMSNSSRVAVASNEINKFSFLLLFAHFEVMLGLFRFSQQVNSSGALFLTLSWGVYALIILALANWKKDRVLGNSALIILLAVSLKAFFYDLSNTGNLIRVGCLLSEGLFLYACGWVFKKMNSWKTLN
jgi:uncharacterized membrane protein